MNIRVETILSTKKIEDEEITVIDDDEEDRGARNGGDTNGGLWRNGGMTGEKWKKKTYIFKSNLAVL